MVFSASGCTRRKLIDYHTTFHHRQTIAQFLDYSHMNAYESRNTQYFFSKIYGNSRTPRKTGYPTKF